jgi:hypothetical protein
VPQREARTVGNDRLDDIVDIQQELNAQVQMPMNDVQQDERLAMNRRPV